MVGVPKVATAEAAFVTEVITTSEAAVIPNPILTEQQTGRFLSQPEGRPNRDSQAEREIREIRRLANTQATVRAPGVPSFHPQMIVRVEGVGKEFGGAYRVLSVVHDVSINGYEMIVDLLHASSSSDPQSTEPTAVGGRTNIGTGAPASSGEEVTPKTQ